MNVEELLKSIEYKSDSDLSNIEVTSIVINSKAVKDGALFIAIKGYQSDGHQYIAEAEARGAAVVMGEAAADHIPSLTIPYLQVKDSRLAAGEAARIFYGNPAQNHIMIGITGTNGKTTTAFMVRHILESASISCGLLGTVGSIINGESLATKNTTPDAITLQQLLRESKDEVIVMEVSSHGIHQQRVGGRMFDYTVFTNLSHDHLDYHNNMEDYFLVKAQLFTYFKNKGIAIVNGDCPWGRRLAKQLRSNHTPVLCFGSADHEKLTLKRMDSKGSPHTFTIAEQGGEITTIELTLPGKYNIENAMAAYLVARRIGLSPQAIANALRTFPGVPGRFEVYEHPEGAKFIVDYAHTPQAIERCLATVKHFSPKKITHIFGFRGNRDKSKREEMVKLSAEVSDTIILTFDDLNGVDEGEMVHELSELRDQYGREKTMLIPDRSEAIHTAWQSAQKDEWIIITGKGPENYHESYKIPAKSDADLIRRLQGNIEDGPPFE